MIYFMEEDSTGRIKIGHTKNPWQRLKAIKIGSSSDITIVAVMDGGRKEEKELHERFSDYKVRGEWFYLSDELSELIRNNRENVETAILMGPGKKKLNQGQMCADLESVGLIRSDIPSIFGWNRHEGRNFYHSKNYPAEVRLFCQIVRDHGLEYAKKAVSLAFSKTIDNSSPIHPSEEECPQTIAELRERIAELEADAALTASRREKNREAMAARRAQRRMAGK